MKEGDFFVAGPTWRGRDALEFRPDQKETADAHPATFRIVPLRTRRIPRDQSADLHRRLPLSRLPEDGGQRVLADRDGSGRRAGGDEGRDGDWRHARAGTATPFLRPLHDVDVYAARRHAVRQCAANDAGRFKLVPAVHGNVCERETALCRDRRCAEFRDVPGDGRDRGVADGVSGMGRARRVSPGALRELARTNNEHYT